MSEQITHIPKLPPRRPDAHKGDFGRVLVIGGSRGMVGAAALAGLAALRSGAGLVRIAVPRDIQLSVATLVPCATTIPLDEDGQGFISAEAMGAMLGAIRDNDVVALGPGLGQSAALRKLVVEVIGGCSCPLVIDADGLNNLAAGLSHHALLRPNVILTPHPGEMRRLWRGAFETDPPDDRIDQAESLARHCHAVVVLKGAGTVVTDGYKTYMNSTGNPGMATGGSGDVLTGIIAALAGGGLEPLDAAILGVYAHGAAGDLAAEKLGQTAMIATDIIEALPDVWRAISN